MNWDIIPSLAISIAAILALLWLFVRWEQRTERRIAEIAREMRMKLTGGKDSHSADGGGQLEEFSRRLQEMQRYQETLRASLEKAIGEAEMRWSKLAAPGEGAAEAHFARLKEKLPLLEESLTDFGETCNELMQGVQRLTEQHKILSEKCEENKTPEETSNLLRQTKALLHNGSKSIETAAEVFNKVSQHVAQFVEFVAGIYKVCDLCKNNAPEVSVCLNCGRKYCDECAGRKIGHCKDCAASYAPLHIDIGEE